MTYKKIFFLFCILLLAYLSYSQSDKQIEELNLIMKIYSKAVENYDTTAMEKIFDDKMIVTSANGNYRNKQQEINDLLSKPANSTLSYFVAENMKLMTDGQTGVVKGILRWQFSNQPVTVRTFTFTFVKKGESWNILAQHIGRSSQ